MARLSQGDFTLTDIRSVVKGADPFMCPYCDQQLQENICEHWVASLVDDSDGFDTVTPIYFGWTEHASELQDKMMSSLDTHFKALCDLCDGAIKKDRGKSLLEALVDFPFAEKALLLKAIEVLNQPESQENYDDTQAALSECDRELKDLFTDLVRRCGGVAIDRGMDHSPGLEWSGTDYCAENAQECVLCVIHETEKATERLRSVQSK